MKGLITIIFLTFTSIALGQTSKAVSDSLRSAQIDRVITQFEGTKSSFKELIRTNMKYPAEARRSGIQGVSVISFTIDENGKSNDFEVINDIGKECNDEVIRIIKLGTWKPNSTSTKFELALTFQLDSFEKILSKSYKNSRKFYLKQDYKASIVSLNSILTLNPYDVEALQRRSIAFFKTGHLGKACLDNARLIQLGHSRIEGIECR